MEIVESHPFDCRSGQALSQGARKDGAPAETLWLRRSVRGGPLAEQQVPGFDVGSVL